MGKVKNEEKKIIHPFSLERKGADLCLILFDQYPPSLDWNWDTYIKNKIKYTMQMI